MKSFFRAMRNKIKKDKSVESIMQTAAKIVQLCHKNGIYIDDFYDAALLILAVLSLSLEKNTHLPLSKFLDTVSDHIKDLRNALLSNHEIKKLFQEPSSFRAVKSFIKMEWGHCRICLEQGLVHIHDDWHLQYACYVCNSLYCDKHICAHLERRIYAT